MKIFMKGILLAMGMAMGSIAFAQTSIEGTWAGKLEVAPGTVITVQFALSQDAGGAWSAVLNSPDMGAIKDIKATSVSFDGGKLDIKVDALSGVYSGTLGDGVVTGEWTQPGSTLAMNLTPFEASVLSDAAKETLMGQWHGKLQGPGIVLNIIFHFEQNEAGEFVGFIQQIDTSPNKVPVADISFENNELFFRVPAAQADYRGTMANAGFNGHLKQATQNMELNVVKGEYVPEQVILSLSDADYDKLAGEWSGNLSVPGGGELTLIMKFERDASGAVAGTFRSPQQGNNPLKITTATLAGSTLSAALTVPPASFSGELEGSTITGSWTQGPGSMPLTLNKQ